MIQYGISKDIKQAASHKLLKFDIIGIKTCEILLYSYYFEAFRVSRHAKRVFFFLPYNIFVLWQTGHNRTRHCSRQIWYDCLVKQDTCAHYPSLTIHISLCLRVAAAESSLSVRSERCRSELKTSTSVWALKKGGTQQGLWMQRTKSMIYGSYCSKDESLRKHTYDGDAVDFVDAWLIVG